MSIPLKLNVSLWEKVIDILMVLTAVIGLGVVIYRKRSKFKGWIPLLIILLLVILPQLYLWKSQNRGFNELRIIYRFALLYITLFVVPLDIHLSRKEICLLIGVFCLFGFVCCVYELTRHSDFREVIPFYFGKRGEVQSFFGQHNRFGAYLALWIILCILAFQLSENKLWFLPAAIFVFFSGVYHEPRRDAAGPSFLPGMSDFLSETAGYQNPADDPGGCSDRG